MRYYLLIPALEYTGHSAVLVTVGVATTVSVFAFQVSATKYIALFQTEDGRKAWAVAKSILTLSLIFSVTATFVFINSSSELSMYFMRNTSWTFVFEVGGIWLFTSSFSTVVQGTIQGMKRYVLLAKMITISRITMRVFAIATLELYHTVLFCDSRLGCLLRYSHCVASYTYCAMPVWKRN